MKTFSDDQEFETLFHSWRNAGHHKNRTILYFGAKWCPPCRKAKPIIAEYEPQLNFNFYYVDVDEYPNTTGFNNVRSLPTIIMFEHGVPVKTLKGFKEQEYRDFFQALINETV